MNFLQTKIQNISYRFGIWLLGKSMICFNKNAGGRYLDDLRCITSIKLDGKMYMFEGRFYNPASSIGNGVFLSTLLWTRDPQYVATRGTRAQKLRKSEAGPSRRPHQNLPIPFPFSLRKAMAANVNLTIDDHISSLIDGWYDKLIINPE